MKNKIKSLLNYKGIFYAKIPYNIQYMYYLKIWN